MKTLSFIMALMVMTTVALAQQPEKAKTTAAPLDVQTVTINVETVQCGMCSKIVEKALKKVDGVKTAKVNIDKKTVTVSFAPGKANLSQLEAAITKSGYQANDKKADPEAYEKLDDCCKIAEE